MNVNFFFKKREKNPARENAQAAGRCGTAGGAADVIENVKTGTGTRRHDMPPWSGLPLKTRDSLRGDFPANPCRESVARRIHFAESDNLRRNMLWRGLPLKMRNALRRDLPANPCRESIARRIHFAESDNLRRNMLWSGLPLKMRNALCRDLPANPCRESITRRIHFAESDNLKRNML
jgi:hypothetical protein